VFGRFLCFLSAAPDSKQRPERDRERERWSEKEGEGRRKGFWFLWVFSTAFVGKEGSGETREKTMTQTPPPQQQQQGMLMNTPPGNVTTEQIQKYLDDNKKLIMAILEHQSAGKFAECSSLQNQLQQNLMYLAKIADAQPPPPQPQGTTPPPNAQMASVQQEQQQQQQQQHYMQASQGQIEWSQQQQQQPMYLQAPRHPFQMNDPKQQQQQQQQRTYQG
ncbi:unnamed protein product, partial [Linum tenue]